MIIPTKTYEKPDSGIYHGVLADIVDLGIVQTTYQGKVTTYPAVRFVWVLDVNGKDGKPLIVTQRYNVSNFHERSNVYKALKQILGAAPNIKQDIDSYLGMTRRLIIQRDQSADGNKDFANIMGYLPPEPNKVVPIPTGFVRDRDKPVVEQAKNRTQQAPQQRPQQAPQQAAPASQPTSSQPTQQQGESLEAQIARLTAELNAKKQGADVNFSAPPTGNANIF